MLVRGGNGREWMVVCLEIFWCFLLCFAGELSEAVARGYYKVLAIKDEYEVARLYTDGDFQRKIASMFEGDYTLNFHLAPPIFNKPKAGEGPKKQQFGPWMMKGFSVLARLKGIRNTWLDPFARTEDRKRELKTLREYEANLDEILQRLTPDNYSVAVELAKLPLDIRGFGPVQERYLATAERKRAELLARLRQQASFVDAAAEVQETLQRIRTTQL